MMFESHMNAQLHYVRPPLCVKGRGTPILVVTRLGPPTFVLARHALARSRLALGLTSTSEVGVALRRRTRKRPRTIGEISPREPHHPPRKPRMASESFIIPCSIRAARWRSNQRSRYVDGLANVRKHIVHDRGIGVTPSGAWASVHGQRVPSDVVLRSGAL